MRFIPGHALVNLLSPIEISLHGIYIYLVLVGTDLLGVGRQGGFSSNKVYTHLLEWLESSHWVCFVLQVVFQTLWTFDEKIEGSAPFLRVPLSNIFVWRFMEEALMFPGGNITASMRSGSSIPSNIIGVYALVSGFMITGMLVWCRFVWFLLFPEVPFFLRGSLIL